MDDVTPSHDGICLPTILVVDDMPMNVMVLVCGLRKEYKVIVAESGEMALQMLNVPDLPDLILLDIMMPGMDGFEVCRRVKANERTRNIPVLFLTACADKDDELRGFSLGAVDFIAKPFEMLIVMARIRAHIELKRKYDLLENLGFMDALTRMPNNRYFEYYLQKRWRQRKGLDMLLGVAFAVIDEHEGIKAKYGKEIEDACIRQVAQAMWKAMVRPQSVVVRYDHNSFAMIIPAQECELIIKAVECVRNYVTKQKVRFSELEDGFLKIRFGLAISSESSELFPIKLVDAAKAMLGMDTSEYKVNWTHMESFHY